MLTLGTLNSIAEAEYGLVLHDLNGREHGISLLIDAARKWLNRQQSVSEGAGWLVGQDAEIDVEAFHDVCDKIGLGKRPTPTQCSEGEAMNPLDYRLTRDNPGRDDEPSEADSLKERLRNPAYADPYQRKLFSEALARIEALEEMLTHRNRILEITRLEAENKRLEEAAATAQATIATLEAENKWLHHDRS